MDHFGLTQRVQNWTRVSCTSLSILHLICKNDKTVEPDVSVASHISEHKLDFAEFDILSTRKRDNVSTLLNFIAADDTAILYYLELRINELKKADDIWLL